MIDKNHVDFDYYKVVIAGYLHDIGKLLVRAGKKRVTNNLNVAHSEHLDNLFNHSKSYLGENFSDKDWLGDKLVKIRKSSFWQDVVDIAKLHHGRDFSQFSKEFEDKKRRLIFIVYMADNIASFDRVSKSKEEVNKENIDFRKQGLTSIFENISDLAEEKKFTNNFSYQAEVLSNDNFENLIPKKEEEVSFKGLANNFLSELVDLIYENLDFANKDQLDVLVSQLDILMQKYLTFVPSDVYQGKVFDISLYDHTKLLVANASVLYIKYFRSESLKNLTYSTKTIKEQKISLIAGDFPGIQKYIFEGIKKQTKITKRLRARSLRVQLLNEAILEYIIDLLWITRANVLTNAGGKFVILFDQIEDKFEESKIWEKINQFLLENFNGELKFSLIAKDYKIGDIFELKELETDKENEENFEENDFKSKKIKDVFAEFAVLFEELSKKKFQIYSKKNLDFLFKQKEVSGKILCKYCGQNYIEKGIEENENSEENICFNCKKEVEIGKKIVKNPFGVKLSYKKGEEFFYKEEILNKENFQKEINNNNKGEEKIFFVIFNHWEYLWAKKNKVVVKSINLYVPQDEGETRSFENIIKIDKESLIGKEKIKGLNYLCLLKGDIDAMSLLFKYGFKYDFKYEIENLEEKKNEKEDKTKIKSFFANSFYSINRLIQFSRFLELFFGLYLQEKMKKEFPNVYTVFSGGDDFVFVLPFGQREKFINFLGKEFNKFIAGNARIHFSLGLGIFKEKTPFKVMDERTEKLLKEAKKKSKIKNKKLVDFLFQEKELSLEDKEKILDKVLIYKGITVYEKDFTEVLENKEISFQKEVKKWQNNKNNKDEKNSFPVGESQIYKIYTELKRFRDILLVEEKADYAQAVLIGARLLNMLNRNSEEIKRSNWFKELQKDLEKIIMKFKLKKGEKNKKLKEINKILRGIVDKIYQDRYLEIVK